MCLACQPKRHEVHRKDAKAQRALRFLFKNLLLQIFEVS